MDDEVTEHRSIEFSLALEESPSFQLKRMASLSPSRIPPSAAACGKASVMPTKVGSSSARPHAANALTRRTPSSNRLASLTGSMPSIASSTQNIASGPSALPRGPSFSGKREDLVLVHSSPLDWIGIELRREREREGER